IEIDLNATTQFLSAKHFLPILRESEHGKFISVTSCMVNFYMEGMSAYSAMKAAAEMFSRTVAVEEKDTGVQVNMYDTLSAKSEGNPAGAHEPMDIVDVLVDLAAAEIVEKHGEIIKPNVEYLIKRFFYPEKNVEKNMEFNEIKNEKGKNFQNL